MYTLEIFDCEKRGQERESKREEERPRERPRDRQGERESERERETEREIDQRARKDMCNTAVNFAVTIFKQQNVIPNSATQLLEPSNSFIFQQGFFFCLKNPLYSRFPVGYIMSNLPVESSSRVQDDRLCAKQKPWIGRCN